MSRNAPYGFDQPGSHGNAVIYREVAPTNLVCETISADRIQTELLAMEGRELTVVHEDGHHIFDFNSRIRTARVDTEALHLGGEVFDPSGFSQHELISETEDTVEIDGDLKVKDATVSYSENTLILDKKLKIPNLVLGEERISDHIEFADATYLKKDTIINFPQQLSVHGKNFSSDPGTGRLRLNAVLQTAGLAIHDSLSDSAFFGGLGTVLGGGEGHVYHHKDTGPVILTVGSQDSNDFQLCVRGKIVSAGIENSGYSSFTLFHHAELEEGSPAGLEGRLYEWTGIPRLSDPQTGAPVSDWKTLHHAHALSSVKLAESGNSQRIAGVLHNVAAQKEDDEFNIHAPHGETRHKYHGERELLRIAASGDHLCWCLEGGHEFSGQMLSGLWTHYENGVEVGQVLMNVNSDMSFSIVDDEGLHSKINALEERLNLLLNL